VRGRHRHHLQRGATFASLFGTFTKRRLLARVTVLVSASANAVKVSAMGGAIAFSQAVAQQRRRVTAERGSGMRMRSSSSTRRVAVETQ
jgi:hypothetical protein